MHYMRFVESKHLTILLYIAKYYILFYLFTLKEFIQFISDRCNLVFIHTIQGSGCHLQPQNSTLNKYNGMQKSILFINFPEIIRSVNQLQVPLLSSEVVIFVLKFVLYFNCIPLHVYETTSDLYIAFKCFTTYNFENSYISSKQYILHLCQISRCLDLGCK